MSTSAIEVSGEKVKAVWDKRLTETFCDICIKEILKGNRPEWKAWKKLKGEDTGLGWNPIKRTVDASDDWWESRLKVVPEAQKFRTSGIDPEFEGKLDQMFMGIVATGDKAWAPSSGTLRSDFFEDVNNEIHEEDDEENVRNVVHFSNDVQIDGNGQKRKNPEISSSHFKTGRNKSSKQIRGAARLSSQIEKLCNAANNMSQATSSLTPVMDPYGIPQAVKVVDSMRKKFPKLVMSIVENYSGDESDDEREKKEILQRMECFNQLFDVASSSVQLYYEKMSKMVFTSLLRVLETRYNLQTSRNISSSEMLGIFLYILGTGAKVSQCQERFQRPGSTISRYFAIVLEKVSRMATDLIAPKDPFFSSIPEQIRNDSRYIQHFKDCIGAIDGTHIAAILPPNEQIPYIGRKGKYYLVDSGYPQMKGYLGPYRGQRYHLPDFRRGRPVSSKEEIFNHSHSPLRSQTMIVVATMTIHNFIRKHVGRNDADFMEYEDINWAYENTIDSENTHGRESDDDDDDDDDGDDDGESSNSSGFEMELTRDAIASSLMNSL
ncbi:hypothetical protein CXB51_010381 [Gossypium anomalum]|uniref:DUF8040 domain-containing protein n=1 Tax=Gossypium anomalum TaxID=47600 RepID=A0A8J6D4B7_9ROSI|nr:hypothetical protein CXB51_010381 [Gossypium anomalum]